MNLVKIIAIIIAVWVILKVKRFILGIRITSGKSVGKKKENNRMIGMDIQDADYEDVE